MFNQRICDFISQVNFLLIVAADSMIYNISEADRKKRESEADMRRNKRRRRRDIKR